MPPLWGLGVVVRVFYKHAAPLGLKTCPSVLPPSVFYPVNPLIMGNPDSDNVHMPPLWGLGVVVRVFYKHAAPLGLKDSQVPLTRGI